MKEYAAILRKCGLFDGIEENDLYAMLDCIGANLAEYGAGEYIFREGDEAKELGIVLSGTVEIERSDFDGNRTILARFESSQIFGESFACAGVKSIPINARAVTDCEILMIDAGKITATCCSACAFHVKAVSNLLKLVSMRNILFHEKIEVTSRRTTRDKLLAYLGLQAKKAGRKNFRIAFDRKDLADYLEVDRSGLSAEISKLRREGIIESRKNEFTLL